MQLTLPRYWYNLGPESDSENVESTVNKCNTNISVKWPVRNFSCDAFLLFGKNTIDVVVSNSQETPVKEITVVGM